MIIGRDIIVVGIQAWDIEIGSNCKNIAEEMARHNRVLYVNPPLDRNTKRQQSADERIQKRIRIGNGLEEDLVLIQQNLWNLYPKKMVESITTPQSSITKAIAESDGDVSLSKQIKEAVTKGC